MRLTFVNSLDFLNVIVMLFCHREMGIYSNPDAASWWGGGEVQGELACVTLTLERAPAFPGYSGPSFWMPRVQQPSREEA